MSAPKTVAPKKGAVDRFLDGIERVCNKLPPPAILFCYLFVIIAILGAIFSFTGITLEHPATHEAIGAKTSSQEKAFSGCSTTSSRTSLVLHRSAWSSP